MTLNSTLVTAFALAFGSIVGAAATIATTWITHPNQTIRGHLEWDLREREALYGEFIKEASRLAVDGVLIIRAASWELNRNESRTHYSSIRLPSQVVWSAPPGGHLSQLTMHLTDAHSHCAISHGCARHTCLSGARIERLARQIREQTTIAGIEALKVHWNLSHDRGRQAVKVARLVLRGEL